MNLERETALYREARRYSWRRCNRIYRKDFDDGKKKKQILIGIWNYKIVFFFLYKIFIDFFLLIFPFLEVRYLKINLYSFYFNNGKISSSHRKSLYMKRAYREFR
jgi:hypothetical protein